MKPFARNELIGVSVILFLIISISLFNFRIAKRRARDAQRRADLGTFSNVLSRYNEDFGFFPPDDNGKIKACKGETFQKDLEEIKALPEFDLQSYFNALTACEWGKDALTDLSDDSYEPYLETILQDSKADEGYSYLYFSNTKRFQIYAYLEGEETEEGYNIGISERELYCGVNICNFGKAFGQTPLEKSIEEYENELEEKSKLQNQNTK